MNQEPSDTAQGLTALCRQAGEQAAAWYAGSGPRAAASESADPGRTPRKRLRTVAVTGGLSLCALFALATQFRTEPVLTSAAVHAAVPPSPHAAALPLPLASPEAPIEPAGWQGSELVLGFDALPLPQAVAWLAHATHATVTGAGLLQKPVAVTLHLRSSDALVAWQRLLQDHAQFNVDCNAAGCRVRITGEIGAAAVGTERSATERDKAPESAVDTELERSQPDGSC
jgi:hypothetical protein